MIKGHHIWFVITKVLYIRVRCIERMFKEFVKGPDILVAISEVRYIRASLYRDSTISRQCHLLL